MEAMVANPENLRPFKKGDPRAVAAGKKGAAIAAANRKKKRERQEIVSAILNNDLSDKQRERVKHMVGELDDDMLCVFTLMVVGMVNSAMKGNVTAFQSLIELADTGRIEDDAESDELSKSLEELGRSL